MNRKSGLPTEPNAAITAWINAGLAKSGKTQRDLAKARGLDPASVNRVLKGMRKLRVDEIEPTARFLGIEPPQGFSTKQGASAPGIIDLAPELRAAVVARAMDMAIEPEEFLARAVRAALALTGSKVGGSRY